MLNIRQKLKIKTACKHYTDYFGIQSCWFYVLIWSLYKIQIKAYTFWNRFIFIWLISVKGRKAPKNSMVPMGTNIWAKGSRQHDDDVGERLQPPLWAKGCMQHNDDGDDKQSIYHDDDDERPRQHDDDDDGAIEFVFWLHNDAQQNPMGLWAQPRGVPTTLS